jgi:hypothetical protein
VGLREERIDDLPCDGLVAVRDVDEVRPVIAESTGSALRAVPNLTSFD